MNKRTLIALVSVFSGACVLLFYAFYEEARNTAITKLNDEQIIHARQAARGIEDFFGTWTRILTSFSKMDEIIDTNADGKRYMNFFYEAHREQISSITRMNEKGSILHTLPFSNSIGSDISGQKHVREVLRDHKPVISDVFKTVQGFDAVALHVPVFRGNVFKGTIAVVINFESLAKRYLDVIKIGRTGYAWVVSRDGTQLYSPIPGFIGKSVFENIKDYPSLISVVNDMLKGHEGAAIYTFNRIGDRDVGQIRKYAVYMPIHIENTFWSIVVASAEQDVLSGLISFRNKLVFVIGAMFICGMVFSALGAKAWFIVKEEEKRKQAEKMLQENERKYRELVQNANSIILRWNRAGEITFLNEFGQKFFGYSEDEILGRHVVGTIVPESESAGMDLGPLMDKICAHPEDFEKNINENMRRNGDRVWIAWTNKMVRDNEGHVLEILSIGSDITERKQTEAELEKYRLHLEELVNERTSDLEAKKNELEQSQLTLRSLLDDMNEAKKELETANERLKTLDRLKSMFIASMSHELRTPLNSIIGFTGMTLQGLSGELNWEQKDNLARVYQSARHLLSLISDVIDISKIEAGKIDSFPEIVSLKKIIDEAIAAVEPQLKDKHLTLTIDMPSEVELNTDRKRLLQCLINFLSNGVKFTEQGGITITTRELNSDVEISVTDTGIGIAEKDMPKLFEAFERLDTHLRVKAGGTGLGLYLTKKLVMDILQGSVTVQSREGQGSKFSLRVSRDLHQVNKIGDVR